MVWKGQLLGHVVSRNGIEMAADKITCIQQARPPNNVLELSSFLRYIDFYRRFIHMFATKALVLYVLTQKDVKFIWTSECQESFQDLKDAASSKPILRQPKWDVIFHVHVYASRVAMGAILTQPDGKADYSVYFVSRRFMVEDITRASLTDVLTYKVKEKKITPKAQGKLDLSPQGELEDAYTLLFDGAYCRQRIKAAGKFVILNEEKEVLKKGIQPHLAHSNNEAEYATLKVGLEECKSMGIRRLMVKRDALLIVRQVQGTWACKNSKLLQWLHEVKLLMKDFEAIQIEHISLQHNKQADNMANSQFEVMVGAIKFKESLFQGQETMEDILYFLETSGCPKHLERVQRHRLVRKALSYQLTEEHLYHKGKDLVLRRVSFVQEIEKILTSCHDGVCGGHFAQEITSRKILQAGFVWPSLHRDVQHWCRACEACQQAGDRKLSYGPRFPIFAYGPFEKWGIDDIGPLPCTFSSKQYILTATDYMTRWAEVAGVTRITAVVVSKFVLDYICSRFGTPLEILSDRGPGFEADLLDALLENLSIKHVHSTPYYPQCNGLVEKTNGVLCKIITKHVRDRPQDWDKHLTVALWAYRTSFKVYTQFTPYHLVYGQEALLPIEVELGSLRVLAKDATCSKEKLEQRILDLQQLELDREVATDYYIAQANKKRELFNNKVKEKKLEEGMLVMRYDSRLDLSPSKKFLQRWEGPYVIFKKFKNGSYRLQDLSGKIHKYPINGWRLKEFFQRIQPLDKEGQPTTRNLQDSSPMEVMHFGLRNAPSTFQSLVETLPTNEEDNEVSLDV
ncbi:hypothetical protein L7F22_046852 [Adiantum nelumboides]|nr:hypothetical protein [Adiantum nelumboides]